LSRLVPRLLSAMFLISSLVYSAAPGGESPYKPSYRYTGPQSSSISEDEAQGKDPILATVFSILPGVLLHGMGNYYAENFEWGNRMLVMELFGAGIGIWGYAMRNNPDGWQRYFGGNDNTIQAGYWVEAAGMGFIVLSWVGDVATASDSAVQYNRDHQLNFQFETMLDRPGVRLTCKF
jgi:hypothetical protein